MQRPPSYVPFAFLYFTLTGEFDISHDIPIRSAASFESRAVFLATRVAVCAAPYDIIWSPLDPVGFAPDIPGASIVLKEGGALP